MHYFFSFLDSYDFASEGAEDIQEDNKPLINASVLGLIFEKINGYKDGSYIKLWGINKKEDKMVYETKLNNNIIDDGNDYTILEN